MTFDNNGNLLSLTEPNGTTLYTWNSRNQLTGISGPGVTASFVYDGLGRREKKTINGSLTEFLFDGVNPVQETSGATVLANILTGLGIDEFFTRTDVPAATTRHFLPDALGSALALADSAGVVQTEYTYEPFGGTTVTGASNTNPFQYTGRENDGTGLYYYRNRYYHPQLQRFISEDPLNLASARLMKQRDLDLSWVLEYLQQEPQELNLYGYVVNNPLNYLDPWGLIHSGWGNPEGCCPGGHNFVDPGPPPPPRENIFPRQPQVPGQGPAQFPYFPRPKIPPSEPPAPPKPPPSRSGNGGSGGAGPGGTGGPAEHSPYP